MPKCRQMFIQIFLILILRTLRLETIVKVNWTQLNTEYYMVARKYEIYFECEQDSSRVSAANECDVLLKTRNTLHMFRSTM